MRKKKGDFASIKEAVFTTFSVDSYAAYAQFVACRMHPGENVDVFLVDLQKLSVPFDGMTERGLKAAFVHGLPDSSCELLPEWRK